MTSANVLGLRQRLGRANRKGTDEYEIGRSERGKRQKTTQAPRQIYGVSERPLRVLPSASVRPSIRRHCQTFDEFEEDLAQS